MHIRSLVGKKVYLFVAVCMTVVLFTGVLLPAKTSYAGKKTVKISLNYKRKAITIGKLLRLKAKLTDKSKKYKVVWKSSNSKVAKVTQKGMVTAKKAGKASITATIKGSKKKAVCVITVKSVNQKEEESTQKPSEQKPADSGDNDSSTEDVKPSATPTLAPEQPGNDDTPTGTPTPTETTAPDTPSGPANPGNPGVPNTPTETEKPAEPEKKSPVLKVTTDKIDGELMTIYILDKTYEGGLNFTFDGQSFSVKGSVKEVLTGLSSLYTTRENKAKTIRMSRKFDKKVKNPFWIITNLKNGNVFYMKAETKNTYDTSYENAGLLYFKGDVRNIVSIDS